MMARGGGRDKFDEKERRSGWGVAPPSRHLWVGNLSPHVIERELSERFFRFGDIESLSYVPGRSYAFVNYRKVEDAVIALKSLQGCNIAGFPVRIEFSKGDKISMNPQDDEYPRHTDERFSIEREEPLLQRDFRLNHRSPEEPYDNPRGNKGAEPSEVLWIGFPLSLNVDEVSLRRAFSPFGEIDKISTFPGRNYAFVQFRSIVAACRAKEALQGKLFNNPRVHICFAKSDSSSSDHFKNSSNPVDSNFRPSFPSGLNGQGSDRFQRDNNFDSPGREFPGPSPRLLSNLDAVSGDNKALLGFGRNNFLRPGAGQGSSVASTFEHSRVREFDPERRMSEDLYERFGSNPAPERSRLWHDIPSERFRRTPPFEDSWDLEEGSFPLSKKLKADPFPDKELPEYPFSDSGQGKHDTGYPRGFPRLPDSSTSYNRNFVSLPFDHKQLPDSRNPIHPLAQGDESWRTFDRLNAGQDSLSSSVNRLQRVNPESRQPLQKEEWKWEGIIAKGGTAVCRARCLPVGKVLDFMLPEFLNCTARTGLDMLAKHYYQATSSWVVFFVPETDADISFYNEFMHYLGEKQRAAVSKLGERVTLFLVPPSDFSEKVLKVPGKLSIAGVILAFEQLSNYDSLQNPLEVIKPKLPTPMYQPTGLAGSGEGTSFGQSGSPEFRPPLQEQNYDSSGQLIPGASVFPQPPRPLPKAGENLFSGVKLSERNREIRHDQVQPQNPALPPKWSNHVHIPGSHSGSFPPPSPDAAFRSVSQTMGESYPVINPKAGEGSNSSKYVPEMPGMNLLPPNKFALQQDYKPPISSAMPFAFQSEHLAQLATLVGIQKQSGKESIVSNSREGQPNFVTNPNLQTHAVVPLSQPQLLRSIPSSVSQVSRTQDVQQHPPVSAGQPVGNIRQPGNHQAPGNSQDTEADPQMRLQATLQLAATLLHQIQQQSKTGDQH